MKENITDIYWQVHNFCSAKCSYCPAKFWGGEEPKPVSEYTRVTKKIIDHYLKLERTINWTFDGGEPLEFFDFPEVLKLCKDANGHVTLNTAGGKLWLDWWAIAPRVDVLHLTVHYWQNPNLVKFIIDAFTKKGDPVNIKVPIRPTHFEEDMFKAEDIENNFGISVNKLPLYNHSEQHAGLFPYTKHQLEILFGKEWAEQHLNTPPKTFSEINIELVNINPSFTGKLCNTGIEKLTISPDGWANGSDCNNTHLGNVFDENFQLPNGPSICKMKACVSSNDQQITKFN